MVRTFESKNHAVYTCVKRRKNILLGGPLNWVRIEVLPLVSSVASDTPKFHSQFSTTLNTEAVVEASYNLQV